MCTSNEVFTDFTQISKQGKAAEAGLWRNVSSELSQHVVDSALMACTV